MATCQYESIQIGQEENVLLFLCRLADDTTSQTDSSYKAQYHLCVKLRSTNQVCDFSFDDDDVVNCFDCGVWFILRSLLAKPNGLIRRPISGEPFVRVPDRWADLGLVRPIASEHLKVGGLNLRSVW